MDSVIRYPSSLQQAATPFHKIGNADKKKIYPTLHELGNFELCDVSAFKITRSETTLCYFWLAFPLALSNRRYSVEETLGSFS